MYHGAQWRINPSNTAAMHVTDSSRRCPLPVFASYRKVADGDAAAFQLYTWNTTVAAAFYGPLQTLEVAKPPLLPCTRLVLGVCTVDVQRQRR